VDKQTSTDDTNTGANGDEKADQADRLDSLYEKICRRIEEDQARSFATYNDALLNRSGHLKDLTIDYLCSRFDTAAYWFHFLVLDYGSVMSAYEPILASQTDQVMKHAEQMTAAWPPRFTRRDVLVRLRARLLGRSQHWKAEAMARARRLEKEHSNDAGDSTRKQEQSTMRKVFFGHGRSPLWRELKDQVLSLGVLDWDEFNREAVAGRTTIDRLKEMLDAATFAFLVMTAEDEMGEGETRARQNVIHEAGLFQGRLGFERAVVLVEDGCSTFSNIDGLTIIKFPTGNIRVTFDDVRRVLVRERLIP